ncbi:MAG: FAD-dependent oxidoreductase [Clostridiales bacterium]|nr:FAD-dependent oxidoreductase [Clostridiales bacterium]
MLDILIIGSGPAGLSAAIYGKRANLNVLVAEKEYLGTGQIAESGLVDNYLGIAEITGYELGEKFREHAEKLGVEFYEGEARQFEPQTDGWKVHFDNGTVLETKTVIYCAGAAHRHLDVPGETEYSGKGVSYCALCDGAFYKDKVTAVIGGGNTALDDALYLSEICKKVYLIHRRSEFRGSAKTLENIRKRDNIEVITDAQVASISGEQKVNGIILKDGQKIAVDGVFVAVGMIPQTKGVEGVVSLDESGYIAADETGKTSAAGLFAAGDVRTKKFRQVVTAVSDGANAAVAAAEYLSHFAK